MPFWVNSSSVLGECHCSNHYTRNCFHELSEAGGAENHCTHAKKMLPYCDSISLLGVYMQVVAAHNYLRSYRGRISSEAAQL